MRRREKKLAALYRPNVIHLVFLEIYSGKGLMERVSRTDFLALPPPLYFFRDPELDSQENIPESTGTWSSTRLRRSLLDNRIISMSTLCMAMRGGSAGPHSFPICPWFGIYRKKRRTKMGDGGGSSCERGGLGEEKGARSVFGHILAAENNRKVSQMT